METLTIVAIPVLFTDIVPTTLLAAELGETRWHDVLNRHDQVTRELISLHVGARVMGLAGAGEVLVSRTVQTTRLGTRYQFTERGLREPRSVPGQWPLFAVTPPRAAESTPE